MAREYSLEKTRNIGFFTPFLPRIHKHSSFKCPVIILFEANNSAYIYIPFTR